MALQIIYGLGGSGKTEKLIEIARSTWKSSDKKVFFIVPEQYSYEMEKKIASRLGVISPKTVEVLSFKRLFHYVCSQVGGGTLPKLTSTGKHIIISKAVKESLNSLKILGKSAKYSGFCDILSSLFSEFKRYNITPEKIKDMTEQLPENDFLSVKIQDIAIIYEAFQKKIESLFYDPDDELTILGEILQKNPDFFKESIVLIDEFEGFTPQELDVITEISKQADDVKITLLTDCLTDTEKNNGLFDMQIRTANALTLISRNYDIEALDPEFMENKAYFKDNPSMAHLEKILRENTYEKFSEESSTHVMFAMNPTCELEQIARMILKLVREEGYRFRDFSVVVRQIDSYKNLAAGIFERYDIPLYINSKTPLVEETPAYALLCAIKCIINKWSYNDVFSYLKTGFSSISDEETDLLENYILKTGIQGTSWTADTPWKYIPRGFDDEARSKINNIRVKLVAPIKKLEQAFNDAKYARDYIIAVTNFIVEEGFYKKITDLAKEFAIEKADISGRFEQIFEMIITSFEDIDSVCSLDEEISGEDFYKMLEAAFNSYTVGNIPTSVDSVTFVDAAKCRASKCKIMFVAGVNDGAFPAVFSSEGVISDDERTTIEAYGLKLAPTTLQKTFDEDFIVYSTLVHPTEHLYLSYSLTDNKGGSLAPSMLIKRIKSVFVKIDEIQNVISDEVPPYGIESIKDALDGYAVYKGAERSGEGIIPEWETVGECIKESGNKDVFDMVSKASCFNNSGAPVSKENLDRLYEDITYTSVSKLEAYKRCPFMYYAKYLLHLQERETSQLKSVDTGTIMHSVIEKVSNKVKEEFTSWKNVEDDRLEAFLEEIIEEELEKYKNSIDTMEPRSLWAFLRLKEAVKTSVYIVKDQLKSSEFVPMGYEISFDDRSKYGAINIKVGEKTFKLIGKVDRGDIYIAPDGKKFIRIIDYKSGSKNFKISELFYGLNLQLAVYLDSLTTQEDAMCAGILYFRLFDPIASVDEDLSDEKAKAHIDKMRKSTGLIVDDVEIAKKMDSALENGESSYLPVHLKNDGTFYASSKIATFEQFEFIKDYVNKAVEKMCRELLKGKTEPRPVKYLDSETCKYCSYKKACHFDSSYGNKQNFLAKIEDDEAWEKIERGEQPDA